MATPEPIRHIAWSARTDERGEQWIEAELAWGDYSPAYHINLGAEAAPTSMIEAAMRKAIWSLCLLLEDDYPDDFAGWQEAIAA